MDNTQIAAETRRLRRRNGASACSLGPPSTPYVEGDLFTLSKLEGRLVGPVSAAMPKIPLVVPDSAATSESPLFTPVSAANSNFLIDSAQTLEFPATRTKQSPAHVSNR